MLTYLITNFWLYNLLSEDAITKYVPMSNLVSLSVETISRLMLGVARTCSTDHCINGFLFKSLIFLPGKPLEPPRANINATLFN